MNNFLFNTYHDNGEYADLSIYGYPTYIITKDNVLLDCTRWFNKNTDFGSIKQMKTNGNVVLKISLPINNNPNFNTKAICVNTIYSNFYRAPWHIVLAPSAQACFKNRDDIKWYQLNEYSFFNDVKDCYYGTNYGQIWSTNSGIFLTPSRSSKNKNDSLKNQKVEVFKIYTKNNEEMYVPCKLVSSYFVPNKNNKIYTTVEYIDGNSKNNHSTNLKWISETNEECISSIEIKKSKILPKETVDLIIRDFNKMPDDKTKDDVYREWAGKLNTSIKNIHSSLNSYYDKATLTALVNPNFKNKVTCSTTRIPFNKCCFVNDYNSTYEYAVLNSFHKGNVIITKDGCIYTCPWKFSHRLFGDKSKWPTRKELDTIEGMKKDYINNNTVVGSINCQYLKCNSLKAFTILNIYFGNSPWYRRILGENINFTIMNAHSEYNHIPEHYFVCDDGNVYSLKFSSYVKPRIRNLNNLCKTSITLTDLDDKTNTRTIDVLVRSFFNKDIDENQVRENVNILFPDLDVEFN